jgi:MoaA/NifB/PqqE/SkfB family radical SAM enzyme
MIKGVFEYNVLSHFKTLPPRQLVVNVTYRCNSRCIMCNIWQWDRKPEMSVSQFEEIMEDPIFEGIERLLISGGEPTLRGDLIELTELFIRKMPRLQTMGIVTNGLAPQKAIAHCTGIAELCQLRDIRLATSISLDGLGRDHDKIRNVPGAFDKVAETIRGIQRLQQKYDFKVGVACVVCPQNVHSLAAFREWCEERGIRLNFQLLGFHETYVSNLDKKSALDLSGRDADALLALMRELGDARSLTNLSAYYWTDMADMYKHKSERRTVCPLAIDSFVLDAYGDIYYCLSVDKIGNCLTDGSCSDIYYDPDNLAYRERVKRSECLSCNSGCFSNVGIAKDAKRYLRFLITGRP